MSNTDSLSKIKSALDAVNAARDEYLQSCFSTSGDLGVYTPAWNKDAVKASHEIKNLTAALLTACEALEEIKCDADSYDSQRIYVNEVQKVIVAKLYNNTADGEGGGI